MLHDSIRRRAPEVAEEQKMTCWMSDYGDEREATDARIMLPSLSPSLKLIN